MCSLTWHIRICAQVASGGSEAGHSRPRPRTHQPAQRRDGQGLVNCREEGKVQLLSQEQPEWQGSHSGSSNQCMHGCLVTGAAAGADVNKADPIAIASSQMSVTQHQ